MKIAYLYGGHIYKISQYWFFDITHVALISDKGFVVNISYDELKENYIKFKLTSKLRKV